jgi:hypothetical protein
MEENRSRKEQSASKLVGGIVSDGRRWRYAVAVAVAGKRHRHVEGLSTVHCMSRIALSPNQLISRHTPAMSPTRSPQMAPSTRYLMSTL